LNGTFAGLPNGSFITVGNVVFEILYNGGSNGHDVVLEATTFTGQAPTQQAPSGVVADPGVTFTWTAVGGADHYDVWVNDLTTRQSQIGRNSDVTGTSWAPGIPLNQGDSYEWWVRGISGAGVEGAWSSGLEFQVAPMAAPTLISPSGLSTTQTPTFTWNAVVGASHYDLWVNDVTTGRSAVLHDNAIQGTSFTPATPLPYGDSFRWWVRGISSNFVTGPWSDSLDFAAAALAAPSLTSPSGQASNVVTFTWNAVAGADHYELWVNDNTTGVRPAIHETTVQATSFTATTSLTVGDTYTWWVRALSGTGQAGLWSTPLSFTVVAFPVPIGPSGTVLDASGMPTFSWNALSGAVSYELWVNDLTASQSKVLDVQNISGTTYTPSTPLTLGDTYEWWVRANLTGGTSPWSGGTVFSIAALPAPTLIAPGGNISDRMPTFSWTAVAGADHYDWWLNDVTAGQALVKGRAIGSTRFSTNMVFVQGHEYAWSVRAVTSTGADGFWSDGLTFTEI
jgi:hypothetical protein